MQPGSMIDHAHRACVADMMSAVHAHLNVYVYVHRPPEQYNMLNELNLGAAEARRADELRGASNAEGRDAGDQKLFAEKGELFSEMCIADASVKSEEREKSTNLH